MMEPMATARSLRAKLRKILPKMTSPKMCIRDSIEGYPYDVEQIISDRGFGRNEYVETTRPLVLVTAPGPGSGKRCV